MRRIPVIFAMAFTLIFTSAAAAFGQVEGGIVIPVQVRKTLRNIGPARLRAELEGKRLVAVKAYCQALTPYRWSNHWYALAAHAVAVLTARAPLLRPRGCRPPKLLGPKKWIYYYLYVILDLFSRYVGLMLDGIIGAQYDQGLRDLKARIENRLQRAEREPAT